ncbi:MAG: hydrogenase maturation nickel metallochaperone HypA [Candidatus Eisenbacteria bacterium]
MHELGIATEAHRLCRASVPAGHRLVRVELAVGELSAVEPELLRYAWESVVEGGPDAACELVIAWCPARQTCAGCGDIAERVPGSWLKLCPRCGQPLRVEGGQELDVVRVEAGPAGQAQENRT